MEPLVTLVMPVWRPRADWLTQAVSSALGQLGCRIELIVVDDGNPEPVARTLGAFADARMRIIRVPHGGPSAARNAGMAEAGGDWIRFIDADDVLEADSTQYLSSFMQGDRRIAYGATLVCDDELRPRRIIASTLHGDVWEQCLLGQFETRLPALLIPRRVVDAAGPWDETFPVSGDWDFILRTLEHAPVAGDQRIALRYRRHSTSVSRGASIAMGETARHRIIDRYLERHPEQRGSALERRARVASSLDRGLAYWRARDPWRAATRWAEAARRDPQEATAWLWGRVRRRLRTTTRPTAPTPR